MIPFYLRQSLAPPEEQNGTMSLSEVGFLLPKVEVRLFMQPTSSGRSQNYGHHVKIPLPALPNYNVQEGL